MAAFSDDLGSVKKEMVGGPNDGWIELKIAKSEVCTGSSDLPERFAEEHAFRG